MAQPYVGEIRVFAGNFAPAGWHFCDGTVLPISEHDVLFQLIGTTYGGDGEETFQLPNLQGRVALHMGTGPDGTTYQIGEMAGVEEVTLTAQQIPNHSHALLVSAAPGVTAEPAGKMLATPPSARRYTTAAPDTAMAADAVGVAGGSQPHSNLQPYLSLNHIISLFGIFPSPT